MYIPESINLIFLQFFNTLLCIFNVICTTLCSLAKLDSRLVKSNIAFCSSHCDKAEKRKKQSLIPQHFTFLQFSTIINSVNVQLKFVNSTKLKLKVTDIGIYMVFPECKGQLLFLYIFSLPLKVLKMFCN